MTEAITTANKKAIFGLSMGHFMVDLYASALIPLYPLLTSKLGIKLSTISLIIALGHLCSSMMQPLFGFIADRMRHRTFMVWGLVMGAVFIPLTAASKDVWTMGICLLIGMCGNALFHPQVTSLVNTFNFNNPNLSKYMGAFMGLGTIGYALGPVISSTFVEHFGLYSLCYITILGVLTAIILYFEVPKIPETTINKSKENFFNIMKEILKKKTYLSLGWIAIVKSGVSISFGTYAPFIFKEKGFTLSQIGIIITLFFVLSGISMITSSKIEKKIGAENIIRLSFWTILPMVLLFMYTIDKSPLLAIIIFILSGYFVFLSVSVTIVAAQNLMKEHKGVISGVMQGFSWGIGALSLAPLGYIAEIIGVDKILIIMALLAFLTGFFGITKDLKQVFKECV